MSRFERSQRIWYFDDIIISEELTIHESYNYYYRDSKYLKNPHDEHGIFLARSAFYRRLQDTKARRNI